MDYNKFILSEFQFYPSYVAKLESRVVLLAGSCQATDALPKKTDVETRLVEFEVLSFWFQGLNEQT